MHSGKCTLEAHTVQSEEKKKNTRRTDKSWGKTAMLRMAGTAVTPTLFGSVK